MVKLVGGGPVINRAYPVYFLYTIISKITLYKQILTFLQIINQHKPRSKTKVHNRLQLGYITDGLLKKIPWFACVYINASGQC